MGIKESSFYYKPKVDPNIKLQSDFDLKSEIEKIQVKYPAYGYRRVKHQLRRSGKKVNHKRIQRVMKKYGLMSALKKAFIPYRTYSDSPGPCFPNRVKGMTLTGPNQMWSTDMTYIKIHSGFIYLSAVLDVYTRVVIGWAISRKIDKELCIAAMKSAIKNRGEHPGCIHHSDQGVQYTSHKYVRFLMDHKFKISISAKGTPTENGYIESFFKTLKHEEILLKGYKTWDEVVKKVPYFIEEVYNKNRLHSSLGYMPPEEYEANIINLVNRPVQKVG
jgi:putative transposase